MDTVRSSAPGGRTRRGIEHRHFADETAGAHHIDNVFIRSPTPDNQHLTIEQNKHLLTMFILLAQGLTRGIFGIDAGLRQFRYALQGEMGKHRRCPQRKHFFDGR